MVFLTFSFPGLAENVLSAAGRDIYTLYNPSLSYIHVYVYISTPLGNHTFASVRGPEEYNFLKACFAPVWQELQDLIADPYVYVEGREYSLNLVFGSDYKVCF